LSIYEIHNENDLHTSDDVVRDVSSIAATADFSARTDLPVPQAVKTHSPGKSGLVKTTCEASRCHNGSVFKDANNIHPLTQLATQAPIALLAIDNRGNVLTANTACKSIIGIPASCLIDTVFQNYLKPDSADKLSDLLNHWNL